VKSHDALALHHGIKHDGTESITVQRKEAGAEKNITIVPGWPRCIMWVHPICNNHGKALPAPPMFSQGNIDTRAPWFTSALLLSVPEVWAAACSVTPKRYDRWKGHLLTQLTRECLPHCGSKRSKGDPFDSGKKKGLRLCTELFRLDGASSFAPSQLVDTFPARLYPTVCVECSSTISVSPDHSATPGEHNRRAVSFSRSRTWPRLGVAYNICFFCLQNQVGQFLDRKSLLQTWRDSPSKLVGAEAPFAPTMQFRKGARTLHCS